MSMSLYPPLCGRVFKSTLYLSTHDLGTRVGPLWPVQYKDWRDADMLAAEKAVNKGGISAQQAA